MLTTTQTNLLHPVNVTDLARGEVIMHAGMEQTVQSVSKLNGEIYVETNLDTLRFDRAAKVSIVL